jgi:hypothetical protein
MKSNIAGYEHGTLEAASSLYYSRPTRVRALPVMFSELNMLQEEGDCGLKRNVQHRETQQS